VNVGDGVGVEVGTSVGNVGDDVGDDVGAGTTLIWGSEAEIPPSVNGKPGTWLTAVAIVNLNVVDAVTSLTIASGLEERSRIVTSTFTEPALNSTLTPLAATPTSPAILLAKLSFRSFRFWLVIKL